MTKILKFFANMNMVIGVFLIGIPIAYLLILAPLQPGVVASNMTPEQETEIIAGQLTDNPNLLGNAGAANARTVVAVQHNVTDKQYIQIPSIGVDTQIYKGDTPATLDKGVWIMPGHGDPEDLSQPTILAAHRWGPDNATYAYRSKNLFYNLPKISDGDIININWNGVDYKYKVVYKEENQYVSRLADLILMTCKYYNSPVRILVYAQRIK